MLKKAVDFLKYLFGKYYVEKNTKHITDDIIKKSLEIDSKFRFINLMDEDDLIPYSNFYQQKINQMTEYNIQLIIPHIQYCYKQDNEIIHKKFSNDINNTNHKLKTDKDIIDIVRNFPIIKYFDESTWKHINICGGLLTKIMSNNNNNKLRNYCDVDIFLSNFDNSEQCLNFIDELSGRYFLLNPHVFSVLKTTNAITYSYVYCDYDCNTDYTINYQIILRNYKSLSQILHGFDIGSCAIGLNNHGISLTTLGITSLLYDINIVDVTRRSTTYETRLIKYLKRGFRIVLNGIHDGLFNKHQLNFKYLSFTNDTNYQSENPNQFNVFENGINIPMLQSTINYNYHDFVSSKIYIGLCKDLINQHVNDIYLYNYRVEQKELEIPSFINIQMKENMLCVINELFEHIFEYKNFGDIQLSIIQDDDLKKCLHLFNTNTNTNTNIKELHQIKDALIEKYNNILLKSINNINEKYKANMQINLNSENPMTQETQLLTGSFNPVLSTYSSWYNE